MKYVYCLIFLSLVCLQNLSAQDTVRINFSKREVLKMPKIKQGNCFRLMVEDVNLNLYKVSVNYSDSSMNKAQTTPVFSSLNLESLTTLSSAIGSFEMFLAPIADLKNFNLGEDSLLVEIEIPDPKDSTDFITYVMENQKLDLNAYSFQTKLLGKMIDDLRFNVYVAELKSLRENNSSGYLDFEEVTDDIFGIREAIIPLQESFVKSKTEYEKISKAYEKTIQNNEELKKIDQAIHQANNALLKLLDDMKSSLNAEKARELLKPLVFIQNNADNTYMSLPMRFENDQVRLKVTIQPRNETYNLQSYQTEIVFPESIKKYINVGISFYGSGAYDEAYSSIKNKITDSTYSYTFNEEDVSKGEMGVAALLRLGTKFGEHEMAGVHFTLGTGVSITNKIKPRFMLGGGFSIGGKHMLAVDGGLAVGYSNVKSKNINLGQSYYEKPETITIPKLQSKGFVAIGYIYQFGK